MNRWLDNPNIEFAFIGDQDANYLGKELVEDHKLVTVNGHRREVLAKIHHLMVNSD